MNLKDAYRYSKFLDSLIGQIGQHFHYSQNFIKTSEKHLKQSSDPNANNEMLDVVSEKMFDGNVSSLIKALNELISEKASLSLAIDIAKANATVSWREGDACLTIDSAININQSYRNVANYIARIKDMKSRNYTKTGKGYRINVEGNQVQYVYSIEAVDTLDFDRNDVIENYKKLLTKADKISAAIDDAMTDDIVEFEAKYNLYDTEKDILAKYVS